jgi:hypothetical protein
MPIRTTEKTVTFTRPFTLTTMEGVQPPGTYRLVTEEEQLPDVSFVAFRRTTTMLHLPANPAPGARRHVVCIEPAELAEALAADAAPSS